ncbi:MAG TPA: cupredoxin family copper-binding protein [Stellaceae bacterium]|nr:cupredoxin family copper-binding protein [Stellaceae bacterium]
MPRISLRLRGAALAVALATLGLAPAAFAQSAMPSMPGMDHMAMPAGQAPMQVAAGPNQVVINNFAFGPTTLTVKRGTTVTWINKDGDAHTVTAAGTKPLFGSNPLDTGDSFSFTFNAPGTYAYFCKIHPTMKGVVVVQ